jgi:hypothetical protein
MRQTTQSTFNPVADATRKEDSKVIQAIYKGNQLDRIGQICKLFHVGFTISRIRFDDGYETTAWNKHLFATLVADATRKEDSKVA